MLVAMLTSWAADGKPHYTTMSDKLSIPWVQMHIISEHENWLGQIYIPHRCRKTQAAVRRRLRSHRRIPDPVATIWAMASTRRPTSTE
jgi:hypothetical protein